jgi:hypothetical protein
MAARPGRRPERHSASFEPAGRDRRRKGTGELGTFFYDSEGNLIGVAQPVREGAPTPAPITSRPVRP